MVTASQGTLLQGDVALIEFIRTLNDQQARDDRFIVGGELGDCALFIKTTKLEFVEQKVREWQQSLRYEPKTGQ